MLSPNTASFCCVAVHISEVILSLRHIRNMTHESTAHEHNNSSCAHDRHLVSSNLESIKVFHWYSAQEKKHQERGDFRRNIRIAASDTESTVRSGFEKITKRNCYREMYDADWSDYY